MAFLGRNAQVKETEEPVHIILDRFSGKTMEVFVEFENMDEVMTAVNRYYHNKERGRSGRLGDRHVALEVSCQEALMKALFPKVKNVTWNGPRPVINARDPNDIYSSGFQGFLTKEELLLLTKCVEQPQRVSFSKAGICNYQLTCTDPVRYQMPSASFRDHHQYHQEGKHEELLEFQYL